VLKIKTNHVPRDVVYPNELTLEEREQFDYMNWDAIEDGAESASFFRYKGELYDLGEFEACLSRSLRDDSPLLKWDGFQPDSFFSGLVVRYVENFERVVVGTYMEVSP
jgi:hypothetical protein